MDRQCEPKFLKFSEEVIRTCSLWIGGNEYKIHSVSIHVTSHTKYEDPFVEKNSTTRKKGTWFIFKDNYQRYIDLDITRHNDRGGIRINCIRSVKTGKFYRTAGDVYDHVLSIVGSSEILNLNGKKFNNAEESKNLLFLKKSKPENVNLLYLPRYANFNLLNNPSEVDVRFLFVTHLITRDMEFFKDDSYAQTSAIVLYLYLIGKELELIKRKIISERQLRTYIKDSIASQSRGCYQNILNAGSSKSLTKKQVCGLFGYVIPLHHKLK